MNPLSPKCRASSSYSKSKRKRQPENGESGRRSSLCCCTRRPSILAASSPASALASEEGADSRNQDGSSNGAGGEWRPWADIASPLLDLLLPRVSFSDHFLLSSVCRSWHDSTADHQHASLLRPHFPWLMIRDSDKSVRNFFCPSDDVYCALYLADTRMKMCVAASHGWLLFTHNGFYREMSVRGFLINPLSKSRIDLPPSRRHCCAAISAPPTEPNSTVMCLGWAEGDRNIHTYFCYVGDEAWHVRREQCVVKSNIAVMGGKFYFLCQEGLAEMDCRRSCPPKWLKLDDSMNLNTRRRLVNRTLDMRHWLVESDGELLLVSLLRCPWNDDGYYAGKIRGKLEAMVHRADFPNKSWARVKNLHGRSLFLSPGSCFSLSMVDSTLDSKQVRDRIYAAGKQVRDHIYAGGKYPPDPSEECKMFLWEEYEVFQGSLEQYPEGLVGKRSSDGVWFTPTT